ncbi:MAG: hypothetical protein J7621_22375 [Niastella sp.]|nr:hypothetical protein [Niastella sp.]
MKTQQFLISYILVHIVPVTDWADLSYQRKRNYHHLVTVSGKAIPLKPLEHKAGCIEVVYVGSDTYAQDSGALFSLLLDLSVAHPDAKIVYASELNQTATAKSLVTAARWLTQHIPRWLQRKLPSYSNLLTLRSLFPLIY